MLITLGISGLGSPIVPNSHFLQFFSKYNHTGAPIRTAPSFLRQIRASCTTSPQRPDHTSLSSHYARSQSDAETHCSAFAQQDNCKKSQALQVLHWSSDARDYRSQSYVQECELAAFHAPQPSGTYLCQPCIFPVCSATERGSPSGLFRDYEGLSGLPMILQNPCFPPFCAVVTSLHALYVLASIFIVSRKYQSHHMGRPSREQR